MILGVGLLTLSDALAKFLTQTYPVGEVLCLRHVAVLCAILPYVGLVAGRSALRVHDWPGQLLRGVFFIGGTGLLILSVKLLPLATVVSINMSAPLFVAALSAPLLGERVSRRRWLAIVTGFVGVLVVVRPGGQTFTWILSIPVGVALCNGLRDLWTRHLARTETSISILFWSNIVVALAGLTSLSDDWIGLDAGGFAWFAFAGVLNACAHFLLIEAMRHGEAALVAPFRYTALLWAVIIGFLVWGDLPDRWVVVGAALIAASGIAMIVRPGPAPPPTRSARIGGP